ncbi:MAG: hypothetical protein PHC51_14285 [bacterium]|nr:hypothetical protein [bacterium]
MIFDKLCGVADQHLRGSTMFNLVSESRLFNLPVRAHEFFDSREKYGPAGSYLLEDFYLPFEVVAIEDTASVVIIADEPRHIQAPVVGLQAKRCFLECLPMNEKYAKEVYKAEVDYASLPYDDDAVCVVWGSISKVYFDHESDELSGVVHPGGAIIANRERIFHFFAGRELSDQCAISGRNTFTAMKEIAYCNTPLRFIVESSLPKQFKKLDEKGCKIPRSHCRPSYSLMELSEIRQLFGTVSQVSHADGVGPRRRHPRTYRHERYAASGLLGTTTWIDGFWVGPDEVMKKNRLYKVLWNR